MGSFRFNGFTIVILQDKVIATQGSLQFVFKDIDAALEVLDFPGILYTSNEAKHLLYRILMMANKDVSKCGMGRAIAGMTV